MDAEDRQSIVDGEQLRLLALFHYISGGITGVFSLFLLTWVGFMSAMFTLEPHARGASTASAPHGQPSPSAIFAFIGALALLFVAYGVLEVAAGRFIAQRRKRVFTIIVQIPRMIMIPYGLLLSIFTLIVLERPSVKRSYRP